MASFNNFFALAKAEGISPFELRYSESTSLSIKVYQDELENYTLASNSSLVGRGIYEGKVGSFSSDKVDKSVAPIMVAAIKENATYGHELDTSFFIEKGRKYKKLKTYNKELDELDPSKLIELCKDISVKAREKDSRVKIVEVYLELIKGTSKLDNSRGLKLSSASNYIVIYASTKVEEGEEVETGLNYALVNSLTDFDVDSFVDKLVADSVAQLGGIIVKSGKYNILYSEDCVATLLKIMLTNVSSFAVDQHLSLFEGKVNSKVLSSKVTLIENPLANNFFSQSFDAEGVPCSKKVLIDKGVLKTYIYDLEMAKKFNCESTGNGSLQNGNVRPELGYVTMKKGKKSKAELIASMKKGILITSLQGIGTGVNVQSGSYSLQAAGFLIENGKIVSPVSLVTVAGNLIEDFNKVLAVSSDVKVTNEGVEAPLVLIKNLSISGK